MNLINIAAIGLSLAIFLVIIGFYKVFVKKKNITTFYTPFDEITGQTEVVFHEEQEILAQGEDKGDDKNKFF